MPPADTVLHLMSASQYRGHLSGVPLGRSRDSAVARFRWWNRAASGAAGNGRREALGSAYGRIVVEGIRSRMRGIVLIAQRTGFRPRAREDDLPQRLDSGCHPRAFRGWGDDCLLRLTCAGGGIVHSSLQWWPDSPDLRTRVPVSLDVTGNPCMKQQIPTQIPARFAWDPIARRRR